MKTLTRTALSIAVTAALASASGIASAEQDVPDEKRQKEIEVIEVTATKRTTSVQETPIAISAFNSEMLDRNQVKDITDLVSMVPTLNIAHHGDSNALDVTLRGVGSTNRTELGDPAVAFHVNDVYAPRPQGAAVLMYDLDRVEVLRGPQGTLFGRNATVGAINLYTTKPKIGEFEANSTIGFGDYGRSIMKGAINIPVTDNFALRFAGYADRIDGDADYISSYGKWYLEEGSAIDGGARMTQDDIRDFAVSQHVTQDNYNGADQVSFRLSGLWKITEEVNWLGSIEHYADNGPGYIQMDPYLVEKGERVVVADSVGNVDMDNLSINSRFEWDINNDLQLTYITGFNNQERSQVTDTDLGVNPDVFQENRTEWSDYEFWSHEIQLKNGDDERFSWVIGAYTSKEENQIRFDIDLYTIAGGNWINFNGNWGDNDNGGGAVFLQPDRELTTSAIYAQGVYKITDALNLTLGARYMEDEKTDVGGRSINCNLTQRSPFPGESSQGQLGDVYEDENIQNGAVDGGTNVGMPDDQHCWVRQVNDNPNPDATGVEDDYRENEWDKTTWLVRTDYQFNEDVMTYASVSTGFKSGILQDTGGTAEPEELTNYEVGFKTFLLDGELKLNGALYYMDYENLQVSAPQLIDTDGDGVLDSQKGSLATTNAAEATIKGLELEATWLITENGMLTVSGAFLNAEYDEYLRADPSGCVINECVTIGDDLVLNDLGGNSLVRAPDYDFTIAYEHEFNLGHGYLTPKLKAQISDEYFLDEFNHGTYTVDAEGNAVENGPYTIENARSQEDFIKWDFSMLYESDNHPYKIEVYVHNITDEEIKAGHGGIELGPKGDFAYYTPPRQMGVNFHYNFE